MAQCWNHRMSHFLQCWQLLPAPNADDFDYFQSMERVYCEPPELAELMRTGRAETKKRIRQIRGIPWRKRPRAADTCL